MSEYIRTYSDEKLEAVAAGYADSTSPKFRHVTTGYDNQVLIVDNKFVLRFPRDEQAQKRQDLEAEVLTYLRDKHPPVPIPRLISRGSNPPHSVYTFLAGEHLNSDDLKAFSRRALNSLAEQMANFVAWLGDVINPQQFREMLIKTDSEPEENWDEYFSRTVRSFVNPAFPTVTALAKALYSEFSAAYPDGVAKTADRVVHDDLLTDNLMFRGRRLGGVLDFGDINIGTIEQELRCTFWVGQEFMEMVSAEVEELQNRPVAMDKIILWAHVSELASLIDRLLERERNSRSYERASKNLKLWFPEMDWSELYA